MKQYVIFWEGTPLSFGKDGVLWASRYATLFPNRRAATKAVRSSIDYAFMHGIQEWSESDYEIIPVREPKP